MELKAEKSDICVTTLDKDLESSLLDGAGCEIQNTGNAYLTTLSLLLIFTPVLSLLVLMYGPSNYEQLAKNEPLSMPSMVFLNFLLLYVGIDNIIGPTIKECPLFYTIVFVFQFIYLDSQLRELGKNLCLSALTMSAFTSWFIITIYCSAGGLFCFRYYNQLNPSSWDMKFFKQYGLSYIHAWFIVVSCLGELCKYSTTSMLNMMIVYGGFSNPMVCCWVVVHVCSMVIVGSLILTSAICCLVFGELDDANDEETDECTPYVFPWLIDQENELVRCLILPFIVVSGYCLYLMQ